MTNAAEDAANEGPDAADAQRELPNFDFETPDEASMQFLEEQWLRFCRRIGYQGEVPDIRAILAAKAASAPERGVHPLVRPFVAVRDWFEDYH
jgi:hypothetical protein